MSDERIAFTIRTDRATYDALQQLYYSTIADHRSSFNAWINALIVDAMAAERPISR